MTGLLQRQADGGPEVDLRFEQVRLQASPGDTVALALLAAGQLETSRSIKYRRPRGAYCLRGDCGSCLIRVDGRPNERSCLTAVEPHMRVESQNRLIPSGPDPSGLVDRVLRGGMDHHHFMVRPKIANRIMQGVARGLTGLGTLPDRLPDTPSEHREHRPTVLIIGGGPAGHGAYDVLSRDVGDVLWLDRRPPDPLAPTHGLVSDTGVFGVYPAEGIISAMTRRGRAAPVLHTVVPQHIVYATGATDPTLPLPNNDLPGIVAARGLLDQLRRSRARPSCPMVVIGDGGLARSAAASLGCSRLATAAVQRIVGGPTVAGVVTSERTHKASIVALAPCPAPAYELARQGGAAVHWDGAGFCVTRDAEGRCATAGPWHSWVCGDAAGYDEATHDDDPRPSDGQTDASCFGRAHDAAARGDGHRVGSAIVNAIRGAS